MLFPSSSTVYGSKPTVWDGDLPFLREMLSAYYSSKPTVWDGDIGFIYTGMYSIRIVPSPPCGITALIPCYLVMGGA